MSCWTRPPSATVPWSRCATWLPSPCRPTRPPSTARASLSTPCSVRRLSWTDDERAATVPCVSRWGVTGRLKGSEQGRETKRVGGGACNYPTESAALVSFFLYFTRTWTLCELTRTGTFWNVPRRDVFLSHWHVFEAFGDFLVESFHLMEYCPALFFFIRFIFGCFKYFKILLNLKYAIYILNFDT